MYCRTDGSRIYYGIAPTSHATHVTQATQATLATQAEAVHWTEYINHKIRTPLPFYSKRRQIWILGCIFDTFIGSQHLILIGHLSWAYGIPAP